jgi:hypothetical protein
VAILSIFATARMCSEFGKFMLLCNIMLFYSEKLLSTEQTELQIHHSYTTGISVGLLRQKRSILLFSCMLRKCVRTLHKLQLKRWSHKSRVWGVAYATFFVMWER